MDLSRYFDYAATTPLAPEVLEAMRPWLEQVPANPHSIHAWGRAAEDAIEHAREQVARAIGAEDPCEVIFTSGASEANNWVIRAAESLAYSPFEHSSVRAPAKRRKAPILANEQFRLKSPESSVSLVSVMSVNNETGAVLAPPSLAEGTQLHRDMTQQLGKLPIELTGIDFASFSSHKIYGPMGVGALYARGGWSPSPLVMGGGQEQGRRAGTVNVPGVVGFGAAAAACVATLEHRAQVATQRREEILSVLSKVPDIQVLESDANVPHILSVVFLGVQGETLVVEADRAGFAISSGSACNSRSSDPSAVLEAYGVPKDQLRSAVRISFGAHNTTESTLELGRILAQSVESLRRSQVPASF